MGNEQHPQHALFYCGVMSHDLIQVNCVNFIPSGCKVASYRVEFYLICI